MTKEPFEVYRYYLALRLHFTTDRYNAIEQRGRVRASRKAFAKRNDLIAIRRIADTYSDNEIINFLVANFISGDRWGGVFDTEAKDRYISWKKRIESLTYTFEKEILYIHNEMLKINKTFTDSMIHEKNKHPYIIKAYLSNNISIETLVILNKLFSFVNKYDEGLQNDIIWPDISRIIKKYEPFLNVRKERFDELFRRAVGHY